MVEFRRDPVTGHVYAYRDGRLAGPVLAMGEVAPPTPSGATGGPRRASEDGARPSARKR